MEGFCFPATDAAVRFRGAEPRLGSFAMRNSTAKDREVTGMDYGKPSVCHKASFFLRPAVKNMPKFARNSPKYENFA
jgi:hypothetical protein